MSRAHFQPMADKWEAARRPAELLMSNDWHLLALVCWMQSEGGRKQGVSESLKAFAQASALRQGGAGWSDAVLETRLWCEGCGETYLVHNLHLCSVCCSTYCTWCQPRQRASNGNPLHHCGGEIVG